jgi:diadenosine tetraphosphate (Ap4A) HIT family hydrolase
MSFLQKIEAAEPSELVKKTFKTYVEFDASQMESFHTMIAGYWKRNIDELDNMDAKQIASLLQQVASLIKNRSSN